MKLLFSNILSTVLSAKFRGGMGGIIFLLWYFEGIRRTAIQLKLERVSNILSFNWAFLYFTFMIGENIHSDLLVRIRIHVSQWYNIIMLFALRVSALTTAIRGVLLLLRLRCAGCSFQRNMWSALATAISRVLLPMQCMECPYLYYARSALTT